MAASVRSHIAPENLRLILLAYGMNHAYRVLGIEEISQAIPHVKRSEVCDVLEGLAHEGLVTRFSGRYCFNRSIPTELRHDIERQITPSGTIRRIA